MTIILLPQVEISPFIQAPPLVYPLEQIPVRPTKLPLCPFVSKPSPVPYKQTEPPVVKPSPTPYNPHVTLPICEHYYRQRGYDFKISNGRVVVVKREKRRTRRRRQGQVKLELLHKHPVQVILLFILSWLILCRGQSPLNQAHLFRSSCDSMHQINPSLGLDRVLCEFRMGLDLGLMSAIYQLLLTTM